MLVSKILFNSSSVFFFYIYITQIYVCIWLTNVPLPKSNLNDSINLICNSGCIAMQYLIGANDIWANKWNFQRIDLVSISYIINLSMRITFPVGESSYFNVTLAYLYSYQFNKLLNLKIFFYACSHILFNWIIRFS